MDIGHDWLPLHTAVMSSRTVVKVLMHTRKVDMNERSDSGRKVVSHAASHGDPERVRILIEDYDDDVDAREHTDQ